MPAHHHTFTKSLAVLSALAAMAAGASAAAAAPATTQPPAVRVLAEPQAGVAPFITMIDSARHSVDLTMYELFDRHVETALARAARRGVTVRVLLNGGYYSQRENTNAAAERYLAAHGVQVRYSPTYFALTHQKTLTVDGVEAAIMTLNFDGRYASTRDYAVIDTQRADVTAIDAAFDADFAHQHTTASAGTGDLVWSPGAASTVTGMIASATSSIDVENEEMAYPAATRALCAASRRGVDVRVVMTYERAWSKGLSWLAGCGVHVHAYYGQGYYIHAKLLLVDGQRALVSSQNLSEGSLQYNRELGIESTDRAVVGALTQFFTADYDGVGYPGSSMATL